MAVFLTYHTLEERDTLHISRVWKWLIVVLLFIVIATAIGTSYSVYALEYIFDMNCYLNASLRLPYTPEECQPLTMTRYDLLHFSDPFISWGRRSDCDYAIFMPLFQAFTSAVCAAMFMIFGRGGASVSGLIPQPWCIVFPSTIYFTVMTCLSVFYVQFMHIGLVKLCKDLVHQNPDCDCFELLNLFKVQEFGVMNKTYDESMYAMMLPSENYILIHVYMYIAMFTYAFMVFVMVLRCLCVTDFKLVRVTIATYDGDIETLFKEHSKLKLHRMSGQKRAMFFSKSKAIVDLELERIVTEVVSTLYIKERTLTSSVQIELELELESVNDSMQSVDEKKKQ